MSLLANYEYRAFFIKNTFLLKVYFAKNAIHFPKITIFAKIICN